MKIDQLKFIPKRFSKGITLFLAVSSLLFTAGTVWFFLQKDLENAKFFADFTKLLYIGLGIWIYFLLKEKAFGTKELLEQTEVFLIKEIPRALQMVSMNQVSFGDEIKYLSNETLVQTRTIYLKGNTHCFYEIAIQGSDKKYYAYVQLNVYRLVVVYFLEKDLDPIWENTFKSTMTGAKNAGWETDYGGVKKTDWFPVSMDFLEIRMLRHMKRDFLHDANEQLFISNDIGAMTRSVIIDCQRALSNESTP
ncbi:hypothetical protein [Herbaspirillum rhizosphaerae]|uniref:hypothetical protein n=1 Tax=Herbaspirillum rhizosphaerae TaxID=346179 RepID=UPI00067D09FC|nr:hypothetical protein [Herbaspirillum rhizosphaerae]